MQKKEIIVHFTTEIDQLTHFGDFANWWFQNHKQYISEATAVGYSYTLEKLLDIFRDWELSDIRPYHIETFLNAAVECKLSKSYIAKCRAMLYQIFRKAEANNLVSKNPVELADPIRRPLSFDFKIPTEKDSFTKDEISRLFDKLPYDKIGVAIRIMLCSGVRLQEMLGFERPHVAADGSLLQVRQAVKIVRGVAKIGPPKSLSSFRDLPVPQIARDPIKYLLSQDGRFLVSGTSDDQPYNPRSFRRAYYNRIEKCGVRPLSPHCCRHTYISQLHAAGVDMDTIRSLAGHSDMDMTQHYLHVQPQIQQAAMRMLEAAYTTNC